MEKLKTAANHSNKKGQDPSHQSAEGNEQKDLSEVAEHRPAREETEATQGLKLERRQASRFGSETENGLDELAAAEPVQAETSPGKRQHQDHLEDGQQHEKGTSADSELSGFATQLYIFSHLIFFSILGVLARVGMQWITFYPGAPVVFSNLWANFPGTMIMGFLLEDRKLFSEERGSRPSEESSGNGPHDARRTPSIRANHNKRKKTIPLYIGLTVGFCGSFTSFSTFERDVFLALANNLPTPLSHPLDASTSPNSTISRHGGYSFEATLAVIIITVATCISALHFGAHCAIALDRITPTLPFRLVRKLIDPLTVFLGFGCWIGAVIMAAVPPDRAGGPAYDGHVETWRGQAIFALVFAPIGCILRFYLSLKLNTLIAWFPLGTFVANMFGTAVLGMTYDLQRAPLGSNAIGGGIIGCQVLQGIEDGFCGALTTVSTWVVELSSLRRRHAYLYGSTSVLAGLGLLVVIMGSMLWTIGFQTPVCVLEVS